MAQTGKLLTLASILVGCLCVVSADLLTCPITVAGRVYNILDGVQDSQDYQYDNSPYVALASFCGNQSAQAYSDEAVLLTNHAAKWNHEPLQGARFVNYEVPVNQTQQLYLYPKITTTPWQWAPLGEPSKTQEYGLIATATEDGETVSVVFKCATSNPAQPAMWVQGQNSNHEFAGTLEDGAVCVLSEVTIEDLFATVRVSGTAANPITYVKNGVAQDGFNSPDPDKMGDFRLAYTSADLHVSLDASAIGATNVPFFSAAVSDIVIESATPGVFRPSITNSALDNTGTAASVSVDFQCANYDNGLYVAKVILSFGDVVTTASRNSLTREDLPAFSDVSFYLAKVCCGQTPAEGSCRYNAMITSVNPSVTTPQCQHEVATNGAVMPYWGNHFLSHFDDNECATDSAYSYNFYGWLRNNNLVRTAHGRGVPVSAKTTSKFTTSVKALMMDGSNDPSDSVTASMGPTTLDAEFGTFDPANPTQADGITGLKVIVNCDPSKPENSGALIQLTVSWPAKECTTDCAPIVIEFPHLCTPKISSNGKALDLTMTGTGAYAAEFPNPLYAMKCYGNKLGMQTDVSAPTKLFDHGWMNPAFAPPQFHGIKQPFGGTGYYQAPVASLASWQSDMWFYTKAVGEIDEDVVDLHFPFADNHDVTSATKCIHTNGDTYCKTRTQFGCSKQSSAGQAAFEDKCFIGGNITGVVFSTGANDPISKQTLGGVVCKRCNSKTNLHLQATTDLDSTNPEADMIKNGVSYDEPEIELLTLTVSSNSAGVGSASFGLWLGGHATSSNQEQPFFVHASYDVDALAVPPPTSTGQKLGKVSTIKRLDENGKLRTEITAEVQCLFSDVTSLVVLNIQPYTVPPGTSPRSFSPFSPKNEFEFGASQIKFWVRCLSHNDVVIDPKSGPGVIAYPAKDVPGSNYYGGPPDDGGMSPAGVFFLVVFLLTLAGCVGGCGYNFRIQGKRGVEVVPFIDFYRRQWNRARGMGSEHSQLSGTSHTDDFQNVGIHVQSGDDGHSINESISKKAGYGAL